MLLLFDAPRTPWRVSSSSDPRALAVVDGTGRFDGAGPHYSRRSPGSRTFTGVGREIVLLTTCGRAVWSVVLQKTPAKKGTGNSRGRDGTADPAVRYVWRNNMFRNLGAGLSSDLITAATGETYRYWILAYGELPNCRLRTEIDPTKIRSTNPGYCYRVAGWQPDTARRRGGKVFLYAPA